MADIKQQLGDATVKGPSTAAIATDFSLVVAVSPNSIANIASGQTAAITGTITTGTSIVGPLTVTGYGLVSVVLTGTYSASAVFEGSMDGVTWLGVTGNQPTNGTNASGFSGPANSLQYVDIPLGAYTQFRVRTSVYVSGTGNVTIAAKAISYSAFSSTVAQGTVPNGAATYVNPVVMAGWDGAAARTLPVTAKGTQNAYATQTQALKDSGRVGIAITTYQAAGIITTEALFAAATFATTRDGGTPVTGVQNTVTAGKRFVIQSFECSLKNTAAAAGTSKLVLRYSGAGGTITNTSPILAIWDLGSNNAVAGNYIGPTTLTLPDGLELIAGSTFALTNLASAITMLHTITINGYEY